MATDPHPIETLARALYDAVTVVKMRADQRAGFSTGTPTWNSASHEIRAEYREIVAVLALQGGLTIPAVSGDPDARPCQAKIPKSYPPFAAPCDGTQEKLTNPLRWHCPRCGADDLIVSGDD